jgi:alcohol dehydrogenase class IV
MLFQPTHISFGDTTSQLSSMVSSNLLCIVSSSVNNQTGIGDEICSNAKKKGASVRLIKRSGDEPTSEEVDKLVADTPAQIDTIIGVGGGSVLDIAKFVAMLKVSGGRCVEYEFAGKKIIGSLPTYLIPTTSGSGSEVTPYSVIQNSTTKRKFTISDPAMFPERALVDPSLTLSLPLSTTIASGLDAFIHCLESFLNTSNNKIVKPLALEGMRISVANLSKISSDPHNLEIRKKLSLASVLGGICIANSRTGLIHTLSVALSGKSSQAHGILNARILPHVLRKNSLHYNGALVRIAEAVMGRTVENDSVAGENLIEWVNAIFKPLNYRFNDAQVIRNAISNLVDRVKQDSQLPQINHGPINEDILNSLFMEIAADAE